MNQSRLVKSGSASWRRTLAILLVAVMVFSAVTPFIGAAGEVPEETLPLSTPEKPVLANRMSMSILADTLGDNINFRTPVPPEPNLWNAANPLPGGMVRFAHAQVPGNFNSFYTFSGVDGSFSTSSGSWRYDANTNTWNALNPFPSPVEGATAASDGSFIFVLGGSSTTQNYIYSIAGNSWSAGSNVPRAVWGAAAGVWSGNLYLVGGDSDFTFGGTSNQVNIYNIASNTWTGVGTNMPQAVTTPGYFQIGQYLYVVGGWTDSSPGSNSQVTQRYDMASDTWTTGPAFTPGKADFALAASGGVLYAIGGDANGGGAFDPTSDVWSLDTGTWPGGAWTDIADNLPMGVTANNGGFYTNTVTGSEVWTVGAYNGAILGNAYYLNSAPPSPYLVAMAPPEQTGYGTFQGEVFQYPITLKNMGTASDSYDLDVLGNSWPTELKTTGFSTPLSEDFEGAFPPTGWSVVDYGDVGKGWFRGDGGEARTNQAGSGLYAIADSDYWWPDVNTGLWTPEMDLSGALAAQLVFDHYYNDIGSADYAEVRVSTDGGSSWDQIAFYNTDVGPFSHEVLSLDDYVGEPEVIIEFHYDDQNWDWYWMIDNVEIQTLIPSGVITETPALGPGATFDFFAEVTIPPTAILGTSDTATILAQSQEDPFSNAAVSTTTYFIAQTPWFDDLESGPGGWTTWDSDQGTAWELGSPSGGVGPENAFSPTDCWGTNIDAYYTIPSQAFLTTPNILLGSNDQVLSFNHWYEIDGWETSMDQEDGGWVEISNDGGATWQQVYPYGGYNDATGDTPPGYGGPVECYAGLQDWTTAVFDLEPWANQLVQLRFNFFTEQWYEETYFAGWYIDNVYVGEIQYFYEVNPAFQFGIGWVGDYVDHPITITNLGSLPDTYRLFCERGMFVWPTEIWDPTNDHEISHSELVLPGESYTFNARVRIPRVNWGEWDLATIGIESVGCGWQQFVNVQTMTSLPPPFYDSFEAGSFGWGPYTTEDWTVNDPNLAGVNTWTANTGGWSMWTNGGAEVMTAPIYLEGWASTVVSYCVQRGSNTFSNFPETGEDLVVEYFNIYNRWVEIDRFYGGGAPGEVFNSVHLLPEDAGDPAFRLRFRQLGGTGGADFWHIDDVYIGQPQSNFQVSPDSIVSIATAGTLRQHTLTVQNNGIHSEMFEIDISNADWPTRVWTPDFTDNFDDGNLNGWTVVDEGWADLPPSNWYVDGNGDLRQTDNIYTYEGQWLPGTFVYNGDVSWDDYILRANMRSTDDDGIGLMARYTDPDNYYRFHWSRDAGWDKDWTTPGMQRRVLDVCVDGEWQVLASDNVPYVQSQWYDVEMKVIGQHIQVYIGGTLTFDVMDDSLDHGCVGLYSWGNTGIYFDDVVVYGESGILGPIGPGRSESFIVTVEVPSDAIMGDEDIAQINIWSQISWNSDISQIISAVPSVHNVDQDTWYMQIQEGIDDANDWETIEVYPKTYNENVIVNRPLTITGIDRETTIIDGGGNGHVVRVTSNDVTFTGFTLRNSAKSGGSSGVFLDDVMRCQIINNDITGCKYGVNSVDSSENIISGNDIMDNFGPGTMVAGDMMTMFASNNGYAGNMFDLFVKEDLTITALDVNMEVAGPTVNIEVYITPGTYVGVDGNAGAWTLVATGSGISQGNNIPTPIDITDFSLTAGNYGFYVHNSNYATAGLMRYTNGANVYENDELRITTGLGKGFPAFSSYNNPRTWNGRIYYEMGWEGTGVHVTGPDWGVADDFAVDSGRWSYYGSATRTGGYARLTQNANSQVGRILLDDPYNGPFIAEFDYLAGGGSGADGMAFNFFKETYTPAGGGSLGAVDLDGTALGYSVEFDNYQNGGEPSANHVAITRNTVSNHLALINDGRTEDNTWHHAKVICHSFGIEVYVDNMDNPLLTYSGTIDMTYGGFSFSAGTGGLNNFHQVDNVLIKPMGNLFTDNNVGYNDNGFVLEGTSNNWIFHNNIIDNTVQAMDDGDLNYWDNGYPSGGNYWSDYSGPDSMNGPLQNLPGRDGIGDEPYVIDGDSQDNYPWRTAYSDGMTAVVTPVEEAETGDELAEGGGGVERTTTVEEPEELTVEPDQTADTEPAPVTGDTDPIDDPVEETPADDDTIEEMPAPDVISQDPVVIQESVQHSDMPLVIVLAAVSMLAAAIIIHRKRK